MKTRIRIGQSLVQYVLIGVIVVGLGYILVPVFQEANKSLVSSSTKANTNLNQEGIITTAISTITPSSTATTTPSLPPLPPGPPPPPPAYGDCGPSGCGTISLPGEEAQCGAIPGPAGVLTDGCWVCNHGSNFWYWETDLTMCQNFWYLGLTGTCNSKCLPYAPPSLGRSGHDCFICINSGVSEGLWADWHDEHDCKDFWEHIPPPNCFSSNDAHYDPTCGSCLGVPPIYGFYVEQITGKKTCWLCDESSNKWINSTEDNSNYCEKYWKTNNPECPSYVPDDKDFPYCGCKKDPPTRGTDPYSNGTCWVCYSGVWIKETNSVKCNDFWLNKNCPSGSPAEPLTCGNSLPGSSPGAGKCWLCTNPLEAYKDWAYDSTNPLYLVAGEPCNSFWVKEKYPSYLDIPGTPDNLNTVCSGSGPYSGITSLDPGIVFDISKGQWGCWLCNVVNGKTWKWVYWQGDRFDNITGTQYEACEKFWMDGEYPDGIPLDPVVNEWIYEYGGTGYEYGRSVVDSGDYLYVTGDESSDVDGGSTDILVMKLNKASGQVIWKHQSGGDQEEKGQSITVDGGFLYVAGYEVSDAGGGHYDAVVMKMNASNGVVQWKKQYGGQGNEKAYSLTILDNEIYVTGLENSDLNGGQEDIFVMKLDSNGNVIWNNQFGGSGRDVGHSIAASVDYIYVTGYEMSDSNGGSADIFVMKLDKSGNVVWKKQYGGNNSDRGYSIVVSNGYIYVTGYEMSDSAGGREDIIAMKLDNNGNVVWSNQYGGSKTEKGYSIAVSDDHLFITGEENSVSGIGQKDLFIMELNKSDGSIIWKNHYGGADNEESNSIIFSKGTLFVTGAERSDLDGGLPDVLLMSLCSHQASSNLGGWSLEGTTLDQEVIDGWVVNGHVINDWIVSSIATGPLGWTVNADDVNWTASGDSITNGTGWGLEGTILNEEQVDWSLLATPVVEWRYQFGGTGSDIGRSIKTPGDGFIYVAGEESSDGGGGNKDVFVMKMDEIGLDGAYGTSDDGTIVWKKQFGGPSDDIANSMAISSGNIYVTGYKVSGATNEDIFVMKLNNNGIVQWKKQYGGNGRDIGLSITVPGNGFVYVVVDENSAAGGGGKGDIAVMKLNEANGNIVWAKQYGGNEDEIEDFYFDIHNYGASISYSSGHIYIAADETSDDTPPSGLRDAVLMKLDDNGNVVFIKQFGGDEEDKFYSIALSATGEIYVAGEENSDESAGSNQDDVLIMKLDNNGNTIWKKQIGGTDGIADDYGDDDVGYQMVLSDGYLYLTGEESSDLSHGGGSKDIFITRIDESNGDVIWKNQYGGCTGSCDADDNDSDVGYSLSVLGNSIYITGKEQSDADGGDFDIVVMKLGINQGASNIDEWPVDQSITVVPGSTTRWTMDGNVINDWTMGDSNNAPDDVTGKWSMLGNNITDWTVISDDINGWTLEGTTLDQEVIDDWVIGL